MFVSYPEFEALNDELQKIAGRARRSGRWVDVENPDGPTPIRRFVGEPVGVTFHSEGETGQQTATVRCLFGGRVTFALEGGSVRRLRDEASKDPHSGALITP